MQIFITLDYELYLQEPAENIDLSLIEPTTQFLHILSEYNLKSVFFVDAGYLYALKRQKSLFPKLESDYNKLVAQIKHIQTLGHEIALHIHPHWQDCTFTGTEWKMDLTRYKLADFPKKEAAEIFKIYYAELKELVSGKIVSYRSGGWCLEPFDYIRDAMKDAGIYIDSTVYEGGYSKTDTHYFDFREYPKKEIWRFSIDPSIEDPNGEFLELPAVSHKLSPLLYWRVLFNTLKGKSSKNNTGKGVRPSFKEVCKKLLFKTLDPVSIDSYKSAMLLKTFKENEFTARRFFCVIGHPKCFTNLTYQNLHAFIRYALSKGHQFSVFREAFPVPPANGQPD